MKVQITRPTIAKKHGVMPGDVLDVSKEEAMELIGAHKAVALKESAVETTDAPVSSDVSVETADLPAANTETFTPVVKNKKKKAGD